MTPAPPLPIFSALLRWENSRLFLGKIYVGFVYQRAQSRWSAVLVCGEHGFTYDVDGFPSKKAAQSALVAAVMEMVVQ